jgi:hypothetical protein
MVAAEEQTDMKNRGAAEGAALIAETGEQHRW